MTKVLRLPRQRGQVAGAGVVWREKKGGGASPGPEINLFNSTRQDLRDRWCCPLLVKLVPRPASS